MIIIEFESQLLSERLPVFRLACWLDCRPSCIGCVLNTQPSGFVELPQPGDDSLPRPRDRAIRFHQRPVGVPLSVFRSVALTDKHEGEC